MADMIKCPVCGTENPQGQDVCRNCKSLLSVPAGDDAIKPGQVPTKKVTAELEPILPQWLKDARDASRNPESQSSSAAMEQPDKTKPIPAPQDLLAGLRSQARNEEDDDVPDWLADITGTQARQKNEPIEPSGVRWVELGEKSDFEADQEEGDAPSWLSGLQSSEQPPEKDELTDWFRNADEAPLSQPAPQAPAQSSPIPGFGSDETPDWLRDMAQEPGSETESKAEQASQDMPDWFSNLGGTEEPAQGEAPAEFAESGSGESDALDLSSDIPAWLMGESEKPKTSKQDTTPPWLKSQGEGTSDSDLPAWLSENEGTVRLPPEPEPLEEPEQLDVIADLPDWLKASAPLSTLFTQSEQASEESAAGQTPQADSAAPTLEPNSLESAPAFTPDASGQMDDLFTDMPDWLSNAIEPASDASSMSKLTPITNEDALAPSELPSWVQAMRPVEHDLSQATFASDQTLESRGALAGLQGVLPAVPGFTPTSKPKAYSIKLDASAEQVKHAEILEQILAAETSPVPIASFASLRTSRGLRWFLAGVILIGIMVALLLPPNSIFSLPVGAPAEVRVIRDTLLISNPLPQNAPVLVAFDYEPSRAAEMELAAHRMMDLLILVSHPTFTFVSTNEAGPLLAERFIAQPKFVDHFNNSGFSYSNLGYLPGGQLGIRAFSQNPKTATPFDINGLSAWTSEAYANFESVGQFAAIIVITDNAEAARMWIEQTQDVRGAIPFVVVSSAQAAPMIEPYYDSGQVLGVVPGMYGGTVFEQFNQDLPGVAKVNWDAYSLGMLVAMMLVLGGGMWNLFLGLRERAAEREVN